MSCLSEIVLLLIVVNIVLGAKIRSPRNYELQMDRLEVINSPGGNSFNFTTMRITKFNRTTYIAKINFEQIADSTDDIEVAIFVQMMQGNVYKLQPYKVNRKPFCDFYKNEFKMIVYNGLKPFCNFASPDECPIPKIPYWVRDYVFDEETTNLPPYLGLGRYRIDMRFYEKGEESGGFMFYTRAVRPGQAD